MTDLAFNGALGVNFSNTLQNSSTKISDAQAAEDIANAGFTVVKMFNYTQDNFFKEAVKNNLKLVPGIPNSMLEDLSAVSQSSLNPTAKAIAAALQPYQANVVAIMVGNEPLINNGASTNGPYLKPALENLLAAIKHSNSGWTTVPALSVPINAGTQQNTYPPSTATFTTAAAPYVEDVCKFLKAHNSFFTINIYPFYARYGAPANVALDYATFQNNVSNPPNPPVIDNNTGKEYYNLFSAEYDATYFALKQLGYGDLPLIVGETGWPTDGGGPDTNDATAMNYNQGLVNFIKAKNGTPEQPNAALFSFLFEMYDEANKSTAPGPFETHWGWYGYDSSQSKWKAKYALSL